MVLKFLAREKLTIGICLTGSNPVASELFVLHFFACCHIFYACSISIRAELLLHASHYSLLHGVPLAEQLRLEKIVIELARSDSSQNSQWDSQVATKGVTQSAVL